jgi:Periplasmic component of the Tol biopolymer transport system
MNFISKNLKNFGLILALVIFASACGKNGGGDLEAGSNIAEQGGEETAPETGPGAQAPVADNCVPTSCETQGKNCGEISDGCGGTLACGECAGNLSCGGAGTENVCGAIRTCYRFGFVSDREFNAENVFLADTCAQAQPRRLTRNHEEGVRFNHLAFKPDGSRLGFEKSFAGVDEFPIPLLSSIPLAANSLTSLEEVGSGDLGEFADDVYSPQFVAFEPNGNRIVAVANTEELNGLGPNSQVVKLQRAKLFDPAQGNAREILDLDLVTNRRFSALLWHPDRNRLIFSRNAPVGDPRLIQVYFINENRTVTVVENNGNGSLLGELLEGSQPAMAPVGNLLAFVRRVAGRSQIFTCHLDAPRIGAFARQSCSQVRQITSQASNTRPAWTPDGQFLLFNSNRDGNPEIYQMKADGSEPLRLTENEGVRDEDPAVHPTSFTLTQN